MFVTISPSDAENVLGLKMVSNTFYRWEKKHPKVKEETDITVDFEMDYMKRNEYIQGNPHFYAIAFQRMVEVFFRHLVGLELDVNTKKTLPVQERGMGVFGKVAAHYSVIETQARGTLHIHTLIFGGSLNAKLLDKAAIKEELWNAAADMIDSMVKAHVSAEAARQDIMRRLSGEPADRPILKDYINRNDILNCIAEPEKSNLLDEKIKFITELSICATNNHTHSSSCHIGKNGMGQCRYYNLEHQKKKQIYS